jgi:hypothetical protein
LIVGGDKLEIISDYKHYKIYIIVSYDEVSNGVDKNKKCWGMIDQGYFFPSYNLLITYLFFLEFVIYLFYD